MAIFRKRDSSSRTSVAVPVDPFAGDAGVRELFDALLAGDWAAAERAYDALATPERRELALSLIPWDLRGRPPTVDQWVQARPDSPTAHLLRGVHGIGFAWEARGSGWADTVGHDAWPTYFDCLRLAEEELGVAAQLDPGDPLPWVFLEITARGLERDLGEGRARFDEAQRRHPGLLFAHHEMLQNLCAKWGGSNDVMFDFARQVTASAPAGSPLPSLVPMAHVECWVTERRPRGYMRSFAPEIVAAAERSVLHPDFVDDATTVYARNQFAHAFWLMGEADLARDQMAAIGTRLSRNPWAYHADGAAATYAQAAAQVRA